MSTEQQMNAHHIGQLHTDLGEAIMAAHWQLALEITTDLHMLMKKQADDSAWPQKIGKYGKR